MQKRILVIFRNTVLSVLNFIVGSPEQSRNAEIARYLFFLFVIVSANVFLGKNLGHIRYPWYANVSIFLLLNINIILTLLLLILLFRHIVKLMTDRKLKLFGARLQTKLVIFAVLFAVFPVSVMYIMSSQVIRGGIDRWFDANIRRGTEESIKLSQEYQSEILRRLETQAVNVATSVKIANRNYNRFKSVTQSHVDNAFFDDVAFFTESGMVFKQPNDSGTPFLFAERSVLDFIFEGNTRCGFSKDTDPPMYWCGSPVLDTRNNVIGALFVANTTSEKIVAGSAAVIGMHELLRQLRYFSYPISTSFNISLFLVALMIIFISIWGSVKFIKGVSEPLKNLVDAANAISRGNLDATVEVKGNDEITMLSKAFNKMAFKLKENVRIALWKDVATRVAHEVKNPLTPIKLTAERVKRKSREITDPALRDIVESGMDTIVTEVEGMLHLMEEFNMFARPASQMYSHVHLLPVVQEVINMQVGYASYFSVDIPPETTLYGDKYQLKRVMLNLIQNSLQVLDKEEKKISVAAVLANDHVRISVEDNGYGINKEDLPNIFIPYFSKKPAGTGLGLAIVKKIIEEHGGTITVESKAGEFTRFDINLPVVV